MVRGRSCLAKGFIILVATGLAITVLQGLFTNSFIVFLLSLAVFVLLIGTHVARAGLTTPLRSRL